MGVQIYVLERRTVTLLIDGSAQEIGTLRRSWKVTEIVSERAAEIDKAKTAYEGSAVPMAVMVADVAELPLATDPTSQISAHLVLGWDADRSSVTDFGWEYLPVLGYAVRREGSTKFELHEEKGGSLYPLSGARALELGIVDRKGRFVRKGQPTITGCRSVRHYITSYAQADCILSNGQTADILTAVEDGTLPLPAWYVGKRPVDVANYQTDCGPIQR